MTAHDTAGSRPGAAIAFGAAERRLLAAMPLHAITACYGEDGLRERLLIEAGRLPAADRDRVLVALAWMGRLHAGDRRQREPYACHPLRVAVRILSHYRVADAARIASQLEKLKAQRRMMGNPLDPDPEFRDLNVDELRVIEAHSGESVLRRGRVMMELGRRAPRDTGAATGYGSPVRAGDRGCGWGRQRDAGLAFGQRQRPRLAGGIAQSPR